MWIRITASGDDLILQFQNSVSFLANARLLLEHGKDREWQLSLEINEETGALTPSAVTEAASNAYARGRITKKRYDLIHAAMTLLELIENESS
jgi:hypothetical protein